MKRIVVISAVNIVEGGTLTILKNCLAYLDSDLNILEKYRVIALVNNKTKFTHDNIEFIEIPRAKKCWIFRLFYEYFYFYKLSRHWNPALWLSLHDITPYVISERKAVYCHNPTLFYTAKLKDILYSYKLVLFSYFYKYLYRINIKSNDFVIVQQAWLRDAFSEIFHIAKNKIIVAYPIENYKENAGSITDKIPLFFFPSLSRSFKNFEVICKASKLLLSSGIYNFKVILTIDGSEDQYSTEIVNKYGGISNIDFCGRISPNEVITLYKRSSCLIFPSKLETWGLPISEYVKYNKPIIASNLPYAKEAASGAELIVYFNPDDVEMLSVLMLDIINNDLSKFKKCEPIYIKQPHTISWQEVFNILLKK